MSDNSVNQYIGSRIEQARRLSQLSLRELASEMCLNLATLKKYISGEASVIPEDLLEFACVFNVSPLFFFEDMPDEIRRQSRRCQVLNNQGLKDFELENAAFYHPFTDNQTLELLHNLQKIEDERITELLTELVRRISAV